MKKIIAAGAIAAGLLVGTAASASAVPGPNFIGKPCQTYKRELHGGYIPGTTYTIWVYTLKSEAPRSCTYNLKKTRGLEWDPYYTGVVTHSKLSYGK